MSQFIQLSVLSRNGKDLPSPGYGFDISDIVVPIRANATGAYFTTRELKGMEVESRNLGRINYTVSDALSLISSQTTGLVILTVIRRRSVIVSSEPMVFVTDRMHESLVPTITAGASFFYQEDGDTLPVEYEVTETVADIIAQTNSSGAVSVRNGLSISGGFVEWGGNPLIHDTTINQAGFDVMFTGAGNFGIGTAAPTSKLHILEGGADPTLPILTLENVAGFIQEFVGNGSPETVVTGNIGDWYTDKLTGGKYTKTTNATNTGWTLLDTNAGDDWNLNGNTVGVLRYIGTNDNFDFPVYTNGAEVARFNTFGQFGVMTGATIVGRVHFYEMVNNINQRNEPVLTVTEDLSGGAAADLGGPITNVIEVIAIPNNSVVTITSKVNCVKTGGLGAGVIGDGCGYIRTATFQNIAGVVTQIGVTDADHTAENLPLNDATFTIAGTNVNVNGVNGDINTTAWTSISKTKK